MRATEIPNFEQLTDLDRLALAEELIASIRDPDSLPAPAAHRVELDRRWTAYKSNPSSAISEDEFWRRVRSQLT
jgi:putative addiction module component (TIGR02574 family)